MEVLSRGGTRRCLGRIGHVSQIVDDGKGSFLINWWRERDDEGQAAQDL